MLPGSRLLDIARDALSSVAARPWRSVLSAAGVAAAVLATILVVGTTSMGRSEVAATFRSQIGDRVRVDVTGDDPGLLLGRRELDAAFPAPGVRSVAALGRFDGVVAEAHPTFGSGGLDVEVYGVWTSGDLQEILDLEMLAGRSFDAGHYQRADRIVLVGTEAARRLHLPPPDGRAAVVLSNRIYVVAGIFDDRSGLGLSGSILLPASTAERDLGLRGFSTVVAVARPPETGADLAARLPRRLLPTRAGDLRVAFRSGDPELAEVVLGELRRLTALSLAVGAIAAAIVMAALMTATVVERRPEIGLRRALGASTANVVTQFMAEGAYIGTTGSTSGVIIGSILLLALAAARGDPVVLPAMLPWLALAEGPIVGIAATAVPAIRAARIDPVAALAAF